LKIDPIECNLNFKFEKEELTIVKKPISLRGTNEIREIRKKNRKENLQLS